MMRRMPGLWVVGISAWLGVQADVSEVGNLIRSRQNGPWSVSTTWEGGTIPGPKARVQIRSGHTVTYDLSSDQPIRSVHVAGTLAFATDRKTRLDVGLIKIQAR